MREIASMTSILLLAATMRSFAHMPLGISDRNNTKAAVQEINYPVRKPKNSCTFDGYSAVFKKVNVS